MPNLKKQTISVKVPAATAPGNYTFREQLDVNMTKAVGYAAYENAHPGAAYRLRVEDDDRPYQSFTNYQDYLATGATDKSGRYTPCDIPAAGNYITVAVQVVGGPLPTALDLDFVFLLQDK